MNMTIIQRRKFDELVSSGGRLEAEGNALSLFLFGVVRRAYQRPGGGIWPGGGRGKGNGVPYLT